MQLFGYHLLLFKSDYDIWHSALSSPGFNTTYTNLWTTKACKVNSYLTLILNDRQEKVGFIDVYNV